MSGKLCQLWARLLGEKSISAVCQRKSDESRAIRLRALIAAILLCSLPGLSLAEDDSAGESTGVQVASPLSDEIENLKKTALQLNRDLLILEEELLFPANTQIMVFVSLDTGEFFRLDAVKLHIDDKLVASHLYTPRQNDALSRGGIQRLYIGNLKTGEHELTAYFTGIGPDKREYKRAATLLIDKEDDPKMLELRIKDSTANMQPEFDFKEWQL